MEMESRNSISPEDRSDGNEPLSAPSEFLAEFLSAIMRRQYAEALKYCRLILQYEPHNATARGFYPLLQHKVRDKRTEGGEWAAPRGSSSGEVSAAAATAAAAARTQQEVMERELLVMDRGGDESECSEAEGRESCSGSRGSRGSRGSVGSQSSLELDSSEPLAHSSPSISYSRRTDHSDSAASGGCWESTGSASRSETDDNGNAPPHPHPHSHTHPQHPPPPALRLGPGDLENDNASASCACAPAPACARARGRAAGESPPPPPPPAAAPLSSLTHDQIAQGEAVRAAASLRRLRAQFTCSIK